MERKLASIVVVKDIQPIENADAIEIVKVLGWQCVAKKDEFKVGDKVIYLEIDSWVPHYLAPFLSKGNIPRKYNGVPGERLRTIKLRGALSQGLVLPLNKIDETDPPSREYNIGDDVTEILGIQKWEPIIPAQLAGVVKGPFPTHIVSKTDETRCIAEGTLITTNKGKIPIEEIIKNHKKYNVLSYNEKTNKDEYRPIKKYIIQRNNNDWYKIITKQGNIIYVTSTHYIYNPVLKCYRQTKNINIGDAVLVK